VQSGVTKEERAAVGTIEEAGCEDLFRYELLVRSSLQLLIGSVLPSKLPKTGLGT
jgi:hypothetical protein